MTEQEFCCDVLKGAWWFYSTSRPQINFCPYCGEELSADLSNEIWANLRKQEQNMLENENPDDGTCGTWEAMQHAKEKDNKK
jgi:hypothetical protein